MPVRDIRVTFGDFDCTALTVAVTLDNTRSTVRADVGISWISTNQDYDESDVITVAPAESRVVQIPVKDNAFTVVSAGDWETGKSLGSVRGLCGKEPVKAQVTIGQVDCGAGTVAVTVDNSMLPVRSTRFGVSTSYRGSSRTFSQQLDVTAGNAKTIRVPVLDRPGGTIRVSEEEVFEAALLVERALLVDCEAAAGGDATATATATAELAATGGANLAAATLGLILLGGGVTAIWLARRRPAG